MAPAPSPEPAAPPVEDKLVLAIGGMTCAACARRVEKALKKVPGVEDAVVNLATHRATVVYEGATTTPGALAAAVADAGYRASEPAAAGQGDADAARRVIAAVVLGVPVVVLGMMETARWVQLALAVAALVAGAPIYRAALGALRHRAADMNVLVALGTGAAFAWSATITILGRGEPVYFEAAVAVIALVLLGRWLEARARARAGESLGRLRRLVPPSVTVLVDGKEERTLVERIAVGDLVVVRPGQTVPIDGEIVDGASAVAEAVLTGEAMPVDKRAGDRVFAGTSNGWGRLVVRASADAGGTQLAHIAEAVEAALGSRAPIARLADRVSGVFAPLVLFAAAGTFAAWLALGHDVPAALEAAVAVLVVACPCALGLATPTALTVGIGRAAELGVLFTNAAALEHLGGVDSIVVDKTGTLTEGQPLLVESRPDDPELLALVAGAEEGSEHPLAGAFLRAAGARGVVVPPAADFVATPGRGVTARVRDRAVVVGSPRFAPPGPLAGDVDVVIARGLTPVVAHVDGVPAAVYGIGDQPRPGARDAVGALRAAGVEVVLLTGDARAVGERVAADLGIARVIADASPADKAREITALRTEGRHVAMVGDGVNDAPALAAADVGIAMGSATDVAAASAGVVLLRDELHTLPAAVTLARRTLGVIRTNLAWAFLYNVLALPAAATGFLSPMLAGAAMALSSLSVVLNSLRLRGAHGTVARPLRDG